MRSTNGEKAVKTKGAGVARYIYTVKLRKLISRVGKSWNPWPWPGQCCPESTRHPTVIIRKITNENYQNIFVYFIFRQFWPSFYNFEIVHTFCESLVAYYHIPWYLPNFGFFLYIAFSRTVILHSGNEQHKMFTFRNFPFTDILLFPEVLILQQTILQTVSAFDKNKKFIYVAFFIGKNNR